MAHFKGVVLLGRRTPSGQGFWCEAPGGRGATLGARAVRSPAGIALLSQRLLSGPQVALAPRRRLGGGLGAAAGLVTVLVAHGFDVAAAAHSPARDGALGRGVRLARGQQRGGPLAAAAGHLGMDRFQRRWLWDCGVGSAHPQSATGHPGWDSSGDGAAGWNPHPQDLKAPSLSHLGEFGLTSKDILGSFTMWPSLALDFTEDSRLGAPAKPPRQNVHNGFHPSYSCEHLYLPITSPTNSVDGS